MSFKQKYLKYKLKYLNIQSLIGGNKDSAKKYFVEHYDVSILQNDSYLISQNIITSDDFSNKELIFDKIYNFITTSENGDFKNSMIKYIDFIIKSYLTNTFGRPSSLENRGRFYASHKKHERLKNLLKLIKTPTHELYAQYSAFKIKEINEMTSLVDLESYLDSDETIIKLNVILDEKDKKKMKQKDVEKRKMEEGEGPEHAKLILNTPYLTIYQPLDEKGSKYYGSNTRWCTAGSEENMFIYYNKIGPLYIIIPTKYGKKYQLHRETNQKMDERDVPISIDVLLDSFAKDDEFIKWLYEYYQPSMMYIQNNTFYIKEEYTKLYTEYTKKNEFSWENIKKLELEYNISSGVSDGKSELTVSKDLFNHCSLLEELILNIGPNIILGNSLKGLKSLKQLTLSNYFNQQLGDSLKGLESLEKLTLGKWFNQSLGNTLKSLTSLKELTLGDNFNKPLGDSLKGLESLEKLTFGEEFNQPLGNSLKSVRLLKELNFGKYFNQPLRDSLQGLKSLKKLYLSNTINSLDSILQRSESFNQPLGESLKDLTSLEELSFSDHFNQPLGDSLKNLTLLKELTFGYHFNQLIGDSFNSLQLLQKLTFGTAFDFYKEQLKPILNNLPLLNDVIHIVNNTLYKYLKENI